MSLLWVQAVGHGLSRIGVLSSWEKEQLPWTRQQHMYGSDPELSQPTEDLWSNLRPGTALWDRVHKLKDSIAEHGYDPQRHGELHLIHWGGGYSKLRSEHPDWPTSHVTGNHGEHLALALNLHDGPDRVPVTVHHALDPDRTRYYHGTSRKLPEGELLQSSGYRPGWPSSPHHTYATTSRDGAEVYAGKAYDTFGGRPRVYEVHPVDPSDLEEDDSEGAGEGSLRSRAGWHIGQEVHEPRNLHAYLSGDEHHRRDDDDDDDEWWGED